MAIDGVHRSPPVRASCPLPAGTQALPARGHDAHRPSHRQSVPPDAQSA